MGGILELSLGLGIVGANGEVLLSLVLETSLVGIVASEVSYLTDEL